MGDPSDSFDTDDADNAPRHDYPTCGAPCDDGTPCLRLVSYEWLRCHQHRETDDEKDGGRISTEIETP